MLINNKMYDFHWLSGGVCQIGIHENRASLKPTWGRVSLMILFSLRDCMLWFVRYNTIPGKFRFARH